MLVCVTIVLLIIGCIDSKESVIWGAGGAGMWKEAVVAYVKILSWHLLVEERRTTHA